jgi:hypothetical protein
MADRENRLIADKRLILILRPTNKSRLMISLTLIEVETHPTGVLAQSALRSMASSAGSSPRPPFLSSPRSPEDEWDT